MNFYCRAEIDSAADARLKQYDADVHAIAGPAFAWPVRMRDWELLRILDGLAGIPAERRLLEIGSFNTYLAAYLAARGRDIVASDRLAARRRKVWLRRLRLAGAKPTEAPVRAWRSVLRRAGAQVRDLDATRLPFPDGAFGAVIALSVLEHIPAVERAVAELYRVLAPGGKLLITMDCAPAPKRYSHGVRYFTPAELETLFAPYPVTSHAAPPNFAPENWTYGLDQPVLPAFIEVTKA